MPALISGTSGNDILYGGTDDTLQGGGGNDAYFINTAFANIIEIAGGGADTVFASGDFTLSDGIYIEEIRAVGPLAMRLAGNGFANLIAGGAGNDVLVGGGGTDTLQGGAGDDEYYLSGANDRVIEATNGGYDTVFTAANFTMGADQSIEVLRADSAAGLALTGNALDSRILGGAGNDTLAGGGGADTLTGGDGDDTYDLTGGTALIVEGADGGSDTVITAADYSLAALGDIENVTIISANGVSVTGNSAANILISGAGADTLGGGGGDDTYRVNSSADQVIEGGSGGSDTVYTSADYTLTAGSSIEILRASGGTGLALTGNALDNLILGGAGNDTLAGGGGADTLTGGEGADTYDLTGGTALIIEDTASEGDTVITASSISLLALNGIENVVISGTNGVLVTGSAVSNIITSGAGADTLSGGDGGDVYYVNSASDQVLEAANGGSDTVYTSANYTLMAGAYIEFLRAVGGAGLALTGNDLDNLIAGGTGIDILLGAGGNDTLVGGGADTLTGGDGDDTYDLTGSNVVIQEGTNGGSDTVITASSYSLQAAEGVENLTLIGTVGVLAGGNAGNNILTSGAGADTLMGGDGDDTYILNSADDVVIEFANGGTDTVIANFAYTLGQGIEFVVITAINGLEIIGNSQGNTLSSGGGDDTLIGGAGDDVFVINSAGDVVIEAVSGGYDTVITSVDYTLGFGATVQALRISGALGLAVAGNEHANQIYSGIGADTLTGGGGGDTFVFADSAAVDLITDFTAGRDHIDLRALDADTGQAGDQGFTTLGAGPAAYQLWTAAVGADLALYGDTNGDSAADFQLLIAQISALHLSDIFL